MVTDFLAQKNFPLWDSPEVVDITTVATGLGLLLGEFSFVEKNARVGEVTDWEQFRRGFLTQKSLAYTFALAAWIRKDLKPTWTKGMRSDLRGQIKKALRYLDKTNDSFFDIDSASTKLLGQPQENWLQAAASGGNSKQIIAIRQFTIDENRTAEQSSILVDKLRSGNESLILNAIWTAEQTKNKSTGVVNELRELLNFPMEDIRAKSLITLAFLGEMDDETVRQAAKMLGSGGKYIEYATAFSLSTLPTVPEDVLLPMNKGMLRALQECDYGLLAHFVTAFDRWVETPEEYFSNVLSEEEAYLEIVLETLGQTRDRFVQLSKKAAS